MEEYRTIVGYENYEVSNFGNVKTIKFNRILKAGIDGGKYYMVYLSIDGKKTNKRIHKLVTQTFLENPDNKPCVDHIDGNKLNNNVSNLRYATHSENSQNCKIRTDNTSGSKGVSFNKASNKWTAQIKIDGISIHLGLFENKEDAIQARIIKANQVFGIYTNLCEKINEI
jgi:hypothetical protein